ncbi:MAG: LysM peptidoglycan-binding domain-containing protein [Anaerolineae bacterium]
MSSKKLKVVMTLFVLALTLVSLFPNSMVQAAERTSPQQQAVGDNLLVNPGFEGIGRPPDNSSENPNNWTRDTYTGAQYGEIYTPEGWVTWWSEDGFKRPECKVIPNVHPFNADPSRIHEGYYSGMCFTFYGEQNAGYYQVVRNIPPGSVVEGSFYAHAWSCSDDNPPVSCGDPYSFYFRVGIDPNGGTDPFSSNIVWSSPYYNYDTYGFVGPVQATVGESGAATLFMQAYGKWPNKHNDAYMDSAALKLVTPAEEPEPTVEPPPPTAEVEEVEEAPTIQVTPTPRPDGAIVHVVESGDTLFGLALEYGVDVQQIYDLNDLDASSLLQIGQEIVISTTGDAAPAPTPEPTEEVTPEAEPTDAEAGEEPVISPGGESEAPAAAPQPGEAAVCVLAFYDANADMFRQPENDEMLLPNAQVNLLARSGPVDSRTTDGISEPWCFEGLEPGNYILRHTPPPGYVLTDGGQLNFTLESGEVESVELAYTRDTSASGETNPETESPDPEGVSSPEENGGVTNVLNVVLRVSGFIVLALAIAVLVLFVLSRRSG